MEEVFATNRPLSILVVEDEPVNQKLIVDILQNLGYSSTLADEGPQALEKVKESDFDVILMDVQMHEMDGLEVTRRIRNGECGEGKSAVYIIAITAYALQNDRERCLAAGMSDYLAKPILIAHLREAMARAYTAISG